jgi:molybdopterin synthase sulfur carrier subunit
LTAFPRLRYLRKVTEEIMVVEVRYFASLVERTGCSSEAVEVGEGTDVSGLWGLLEQRHPALADVGFRPLVACDLTYADWDRPLDGVREVAFLPPFSGG